MTEDVQKDRVETGITQGSEETKETPKTSTTKQEKQDITYQDIFDKIGKRIKDKDVLNDLKKDYEKHLPSSVSKNKVADLEDSLLEDYVERKAKKSSEEKLAEKMKEIENQANSFFEKNGQKINQEELDDLITYKVVENSEELEIIKQNPILAKRTMEALTIAKSKNQLLPKATNIDRTKEDIKKEIQELDNIRMKSGLSTKEAARYNTLFSQYSSFKK